MGREHKTKLSDEALGMVAERFKVLSEPMRLRTRKAGGRPRPFHRDDEPFPTVDRSLRPRTTRGSRSGQRE
jgi:hypothetical protein